MYSTPIILIIAFVVLLVVVVRRARKRMPKHGSPVTTAGMDSAKNPKK